MKIQKKIIPIKNILTTSPGIKISNEKKQKTKESEAKNRKKSEENLYQKKKKRTKH